MIPAKRPVGRLPGSSQPKLPTPPTAPLPTSPPSRKMMAVEDEVNFGDSGDDSDVDEDAMREMTELFEAEEAEARAKKANPVAPVRGVVMASPNSMTSTPNGGSNSLPMVTIPNNSPIVAIPSSAMVTPGSTTQKTDLVAPLVAVSEG